MTALQLDPVNEFLNSLPSGWTRIPLKRCVAIRITDGPHETPELVDDGIPFVSAESVRDGQLDFSRRRGNISAELHRQYCKKCFPRRDDVFLCKSGATTGKVAIVNVDFEFSVWSPLAQIRAKNSIALPRYLFWTLQAKYIQDQIKTTWSHGTQPNISMGAIEQLMLGLPPLDYQQHVIDLLDSETDRISRISSGISVLSPATGCIARFALLLDEYREALISAAVTGRIDINERKKEATCP
jgi:type I restriction enzyme S subunit